MSETLDTGTQTWRQLRAIGLKGCTDCHTIKPIGEFTRFNKNGYTCYRACCKPCAVLRTQAWQRRQKAA